MTHAAPALPRQEQEYRGLARRRRYSAGRSAGAIIADRPSTRHVQAWYVHLRATRQTVREDERQRRPPLLRGSVATRWRPTPTRRKKPPNLVAVTCCFGWEIWSGRRDSNPRPQPWQGCALPLSYTRSRGTEAASRAYMAEARCDCNREILAADPPGQPALLAPFSRR